jgi:hypothetical protein
MGKYKHFTDKQKLRLRDLRKHNKTAKQISKMMNISETGVYRHSKDIFYKRKKDELRIYENKVKKAQDKDLSYVAGIIDGEGCLSIGKHKTNTKPTYFPVLDITNSNKKIIYFVESVIPSNYICFRENYSKNEIAKPVYVYRIYSKDKLFIALNSLKNRLIGKKKQANIILKFIKTKSIEKQEEYYIMMSKLNKKGKIK